MRDIGTLIWVVLVIRRRRQQHALEHAPPASGSAADAAATGTVAARSAATARGCRAGRRPAAPHGDAPGPDAGWAVASAPAPRHGRPAQPVAAGRPRLRRADRPPRSRPCPGSLGHPAARTSAASSDRRATRGGVIAAEVLGKPRGLNDEYHWSLNRRTIDRPSGALRPRAPLWRVRPQPLGARVAHSTWPFTPTATGCCLPATSRPSARRDGRTPHARCSRGRRAHYARRRRARALRRERLQTAMRLSGHAAAHASRPRDSAAHGRTARVRSLDRTKQR